jgi:hypothetical protein
MSVATCQCIEGQAHEPLTPARKTVTCTCTGKKAEGLGERPLETNSAQLAPGRSLSGLWQQGRSALMLGIACLTSPCCTPILVSMALTLLAGTPAAVWIGQYTWWVYSTFTLVSLVSLVVGVRWFRTAG